MKTSTRPARTSTVPVALPRTTAKLEVWAAEAAGSARPLALHTAVASQRSHTPGHRGTIMPAVGAPILVLPMVRKREKERTNKEIENISRRRDGGMIGFLEAAFWDEHITDFEHGVVARERREIWLSPLEERLDPFLEVWVGGEQRRFHQSHSLLGGLFVRERGVHPELPLHRCHAHWAHLINRPDKRQPGSPDYFRSHSDHLTISAHKVAMEHAMEQSLQNRENGCSKSTEREIKGNKISRQCAPRRPCAGQRRESLPTRHPQTLSVPGQADRPRLHQSPAIKLERVRRQPPNTVV